MEQKGGGHRPNPQSLPTPSLPHTISQPVPNFLPKCDSMLRKILVFQAVGVTGAILTLSVLTVLFWSSCIPSAVGMGSGVGGPWLYT